LSRTRPDALAAATWHGHYGTREVTREVGLDDLLRITSHEPNDVHSARGQISAQSFRDGAADECLDPKVRESLDLEGAINPINGLVDARLHGPVFDRENHQLAGRIKDRRDAALPDRHG